MRIQGTNIYLTRGDTAYFTLVILDQNDEVIVLNENDDEIVFTVKTSVHTIEKVFSVSGNIQENNEVSFHIKPSDTEGRDYGRYFYDIQLTRKGQSLDGEDDVFTIVTPSIFFIGDEVTFDYGQ